MDSTCIIRTALIFALCSTLIAALGGGNYTAIVRGKSDSTGVGLDEVYNVN